MPLAEERITSRYSISAYTSDDITVNEKQYPQSFILAPETLICPSPINTLEDLNEQTIQNVLDLKPDVVLLGTGEKQIFPAPRIFALFGEKGIGLEVMNTGALCRTFNILVAEDRDVVAVIIQD
ncbi:MAG: hypothetical protein ACI9KN_000311 [Gammaproteobacteria bacterium]|jgi:uncharacterized protein